MTLYRFLFQADVPKSAIEASLLLAFIAIEGLHGESQARLDVGQTNGGTLGVCVIDASTPVGRDLAKVFTALIRREFGEDSFRVERLPSTNPETTK